MKNFDFNRFVNVAKWDVAINRSFYMKMALVVFTVMAFNVLTYMATVWWHVEMSDGEAIGPTMMLAPIFASMQVTMLTRYFTVLPLLLGTIFHNLRTRQGRIGELTLPATNLEKFVWHVLFVLLSSAAAAVVSYLVLDVVQYLYTGIMLGFEDAGFMITHYEWLHGLIDAARGFLAGSELHDVVVMLLVFGCCAYVAYASTFALGNALKYRHNVVLTLLFHVLFFFVGLFMMGFVVAMVAQNLEFFEHWFYKEEIGMTICSLIFVAVAMLCWWRTWVLYTRAQITTRRNK